MEYKKGGAPIAVFLSLMLLIIVGALFISGNFSSSSSKMTGYSISPEMRKGLTGDAIITGDLVSPFTFTENVGYCAGNIKKTCSQDSDCGAAQICVGNPVSYCKLNCNLWDTLIGCRSGTYNNLPVPAVCETGQDGIDIFGCVQKYNCANIPNYNANNCTNNPLYPTCNWETSGRCIGTAKSCEEHANPAGGACYLTHPEGCYSIFRENMDDLCFGTPVACSDLNSVNCEINKGCDWVLYSEDKCEDYRAQGKCGITSIGVGDYLDCGTTCTNPDKACNSATNLCTCYASNCDSGKCKCADGELMCSDGTENTCVCNPSCTGKKCGESDGCDGMCVSGSGCTDETDISTTPPEEGHCKITTLGACTGTDIYILAKLSATKNAFANTPTEINLQYDKAICCRKSGITNTCASDDSNVLFYLNSLTNQSKRTFSDGRCVGTDTIGIACFLLAGGYNQQIKCESYAKYGCSYDSASLYCKGPINYDLINIKQDCQTLIAGSVASKWIPADKKICAGPVADFKTNWDGTSCSGATDKVLASLSEETNGEISYGRSGTINVCTSLIVDSFGEDCGTYTAKDSCIEMGNECSWYPPEEESTGKCCDWNYSEGGVHKIAQKDQTTGEYVCQPTDNTCTLPWTPGAITNQKIESVRPRNPSPLSEGQKYNSYCAKVSSTNLGILEAPECYPEACQ